jgi:GTP cyclohydrolase IA
MTADRQAAASAIDAFLRAIGRDPKLETELAGTGARVAEAFIDELCEGYGVDVAKLLAGNVIEGESGLVVVRDIAVTTTCPHHLMQATGVATVAFAPERRVVGLGAIARLVDAYARRLALQERIGEDVVSALITHVAPRWAGCRLLMSHGCMTARGERKHGSRVESVALRAARGVLSDADSTLANRALGVGL